MREETGRRQGGVREKAGRSEEETGGVREEAGRLVSSTLSSLMVCTHWAMEASVGAQYSFISFSLQEDGG